MKTVIVFDIDGTLTPPRKPIQEEMVNILNRLRVPFYVAAGSDMDLLENQFFSPLAQYGFTGRFEAFISNGAIHYHCNYRMEKPIERLSSFELETYLGPVDYGFLCDQLEKTLLIPKFKLPGDIEIFDNRIKDRSSMINFCPIGRKTIENTNERQNRERFVRYDTATGFRRQVLTHLKKELTDLISQKNLHITLGGQTSFDIGIKGEDKTKPIRTLVEKGVENIVFIGDALYEGGNDAVINEYIQNWDNSAIPCPVRALQVNVTSDDIHNSWKETKAILKENNWV